MKRSKLAVFFAVMSFAVAVPTFADHSHMPDGLHMHGLVDVNYGYNLNNTPLSSNLGSASQNNYRFADRGHNQFDLSALQIGVMQKPAPFGFNVTLGAGTQMDALNTPRGGQVDAAYRFVRNATINWEKESCFGSVGRMDANFGFEKIDSINNMNYSRSLGFTLIQPKLLNGMEWGMKHGDFSWSVIAANGFDRYGDNNRAKTFGGKMVWDFEKTMYKFSYLTGGERNNLNGRWRHTASISTLHHYTESHSYGLDGTYSAGTREPINSTGSFDKATRWDASLYASYKWFDYSTENFRLEWLRDQQGGATMTAIPATIYSGTITHKIEASKNFTWLVEGRYDFSNKQVFDDSDGNMKKKNQATAMIAGTFHI